MVNHNFYYKGLKCYVTVRRRERAFAYSLPTAMYIATEHWNRGMKNCYGMTCADLQFDGSKNLMPYKFNKDDLKVTTTTYLTALALLPWFIFGPMRV